jgi:hypothetical protein
VERLASVLRLRGALREDERDRLACVRHDFLRQDFRTRGRDEARVRDLKRQAFERGDVRRHDDVHDAGLATGIGALDLHDARVRVRAAHHRDVQHARQFQIGDVPPAARHETRIFAPPDLRSEQPLAQ